MRRLLIGKITSKGYFITPADTNFHPHTYRSKSNSSSNAEQREPVSDRALVRQAYQAVPLTKENQKRIKEDHYFLPTYI